MTEYCFVVNPNAGKGKGARVARRVQATLRERNIPAEFCFTTGPLEATHLAKNSTARTVVAIGGDGTINEVVNGLREGHRRLGVIPAGSGNDLIKSVGIPRNTAKALDILLAGNVKDIDVGLISCSVEQKVPVPGNEQMRCFVNGVGIGFDAEVAARIPNIPILGGTLLYIAAVIQTLGHFKAPLFRMSIDGRSEQGRWLLAAIGNGTCAGGGFYLTPRAKVDDGLLDVCAVSDRSIPEILRLMPLVMRGKHTEEYQLKFLRGKDIGVEAETPFYVHADGEIVGRGVRKVRISIAPFKLPMIVGH